MCAASPTGLGPELSTIAQRMTPSSRFVSDRVALQDEFPDAPFLTTSLREAPDGTASAPRPRASFWRRLVGQRPITRVPHPTRWPVSRVPLPVPMARPAGPTAHAGRCVAKGGA